MPSPSSPANAPVPPNVAIPSAHEATTLTRFLARLSVDIDLLHQMICDPHAVFEKEGLSAEDIAALISRQAAPIERAMMKEVKA